MNQPHAPYSFMMAIGEYAIVPDKWNNIRLNTMWSRNMKKMQNYF